jgi:hypothetical protein
MYRFISIENCAVGDVQPIGNIVDGVVKTVPLEKIKQFLLFFFLGRRVAGVEIHEGRLFS